MQKLSDVDKLVTEISSREKALHVLVNNAGAAWGDKFDTYPVRPTSGLSMVVIEFSFTGPRLDKSPDVEPSPSVYPHSEMLTSPSSCRKRGWKRG